MKLFLFAAIGVASLFISSCQSPIESKGSPVVIPSLVSPPDREGNVSLTPSFSWINEAQRFEISKSPSFDNIVYSYDVSGTTCSLPEGYLQPYTWYFWHAGTVSSGATYWSDKIYSFQTGGN